MQKMLQWFKKNKIKIILGSIVMSITIIIILVFLGRITAAISTLIGVVLIGGGIAKATQQKDYIKKEGREKIEEIKTNDYNGVSDKLDGLIERRAKKRTKKNRTRISRQKRFLDK